MLPDRKFLRWSKLGGPVRLNLNNDVFRLDIGPWTYTVKSVPGQFPAWRQVVPPDEGIAVCIDEEERATFTHLLPTLPGHDSQDGLVVLCRCNGQVAVCGQHSLNGAWMAVPIGKPDGGPDVSTCVNRTFLLDALNSGFFSVKITDRLAPLRFQTGQGDVHVLMPMRPDDALVAAALEAAGNTKTRKQTRLNPVAIKDPEPVPEIVTTQSEEEVMQEETKVSALDRLQEMYRVARVKVRDANLALSDIAVVIREAVREEKQSRMEVAAVRAGLSKIKSTTV